MHAQSSNAAPSSTGRIAANAALPVSSPHSRWPPPATPRAPPKACPICPAPPRVYIGAIPPFPGVYYLLQSEYFNDDQLNGPNNTKLPVPFHASGATIVHRFLYVWPLTLPGGGQVATQAVIPIVNLNLRVGPASQSRTDLAGFILTPALVNWTIARNATFTVGTDVSFPVGFYDPTSLTSLGNNYYSLQPIGVLRYNNPKGLDLAVSPRFAFNFQNDATHYRTGNIFYLEYEANWNAGRWKLGFVGGLGTQVGDDTINGHQAPLNGNRYESFSFGPSVAVNFGPFSVSANFQHDFVARNTPRGDVAWLNVALPISLLLSGKPPV